MTTHVDVEPVSKPDETRALIERVERVVRRDERGRFELLRRANWIAIPAESAAHLRSVDIEGLLAVLQSREIPCVYAVVLEPLNDVPSVLKVQASVPGLKAFNWECGLYNYALVPEDASFVVVCTTDDYLVFAGPAEFVGTAVGATREEALQAFEAFALDPGWSEEMRRLFISVYEPLRDEYPKAADGEFVRFPK